jgi:CheY-like chemotaxis protein
MNGYEATQKIRELQQETHIPIIAVTAGNLKGEKEKCLEAGMDDFVAKPFVEDAIIVLFEKWTGGIRKKGEKAGVGSVQDAGIHFNVETIKSYVGDDNEILEEFLGLTISELEKSCNTLLEEAEKKDLAGLKRIGHKLYGTAVTAGTLALAELAREIELLIEFNPEIVARLLLQTQDEIRLVKQLITEMMITNEG